MHFSNTPVSLEKIAANACLKLCASYAKNNLKYIDCKEKRILMAINIIIPDHLVSIVKERFFMYKWIYDNKFKHICYYN